MSISIEILESENQIISGVPETVSIVPIDNIVLYYSLDGEDPDSESLLVDGPINMPTDGISVELRVVGLKLDPESGELVVATDIFGKTYYPDPYSNSKSRHSYDGVIVIPYGEDLADSLSLLTDGEAAQGSAVELKELEIKASTSSRSGGKIPNDSTIEFVRKPIAAGSIADDRKPSSVNSIDFNPKASVIEIDGRTQQAKDSQVVRIVNRSYNSIDPTSNFYSENWKRNEQVITGNLVRSIYNNNTGVIVFYYWDSKESKWLTSMQNIGARDPYNISGSGPSGRGNRFVYRWIQERAFTRIF